MRHGINLIVFIFSSMGLLALSEFSHAADVKTLALVADPWCPFTCEPEAANQGLMIDVAREVLQAQGYKIEYKTLNWARAIDDTRAGKYSAIVGALRPDAPDFIFPKVSFADQKSCFYRLKDGSWKYTGLESLKDMTIGLVNDYKYGDPFDGWVEQQKVGKSKAIDFVAGVGTTEKLFLKLQEKRIKAIIEDESVVTYLAARPGNPIAKVAFEKVGCLEKQPLYVAFSPGNKESAALADAFDQGYAKAVAAKKIEAIKKKYFGAK